MRKIREILRLKFACNLSKRQIAPVVGIVPTSVTNTLNRAARAGLSWPLPSDLSDDALERLLFPPPPAVPSAARPQPDWGAIHRELRKPHVTLALLWEEYRAQAPNGFGYSWFCQTYREWAGRLTPTLRQVHVAGEKVFVDFSGKKAAVVDPATGEVRAAELFVGVLGASNYTYAEATWSQTLPEWIGAHVNMLAFFGGVPRALVPDNLKAGVLKASFYDPALNRTYADLASHYGTVILPARPRRPRDKAKVEVAVQVVQRWILARLRHLTCFSLAELNQAITGLLTELNDRPMKRLGTTRRQLFEHFDRPALRPLPAEPYVYAEWKKGRVGLDYHVEADRHFYSVPHTLLRQEVEVRLTARTVEIFHRGQRVAVHLRHGAGRQRHTTQPDHMPSAHRRYAETTPERLRDQAAAIGPDTAALVDLILADRPHPEQGFRSVVGLLRLAKSYGPERLEAASTRALALGARSYTSLASILKNGLDRQAAAPATTDTAPLIHANLRGSRYYH